MRRLALEDSRKIKILALANQLGNPLVVNNYLRGLWHIVPDPEAAEFVRAPLYQIELAEENGYYLGDCDDAATLAGSLLAALNIPCSLIAIRMPADVEFSHVFLRCNVNGYPFDIDPIVPQEFLPIRGAVETMEEPIC